MKLGMKVIKHDLGVDTESVNIVAIADCHLGADAFDEDKFLNHRQMILDTPNTYCLIVGDLLEMGTRQSVSDLWGSLRPAEQRKLAIRYLEPLAEAGKILAYIDGNHEARAQKDSDELVGEMICWALDISNVYHPDAAYLFLQVGHNHDKGGKSEKNKEKNRLVYTAYMVHGWSSARTKGAKANNLERLAQVVIADMYFIAHSHQQMIFPDKVLVPETRSKSLRWQKSMFINTGSYLDYLGYPVRKGMSPVETGVPHVVLNGTRREIKGITTLEG